MTQDVRSDPGGLVPGEQLAGYQIQEQIGRGGMAVVYRALDLRLGRVVALKVLAPHLGEDDAFRQRFIRESRALAGVDHPHIIPVFEAGEQGGVLFIAMRFVENGDVRRLLDTEGRLSPSRTSAITVQVASALDTAHAHGLVHRDVKPGNMLLALASNNADHVYLSDFGLSKHSLASSTLTSTGQFLGTLDYVSPEQIQGHPVDGRADQYALACTVVEMLTGAPPFRRDDSMAIMWAQLESEPPKVTQRRPELPSAVDEVLAAALAKSPASRYPTCRDFALALKAACDGPTGPRTALAPFPARWPDTQAAPAPYASPIPAVPQDGHFALPRDGFPRNALPQPAPAPAGQSPSLRPADPWADRQQAGPRPVSSEAAWAPAPRTGGPAQGKVVPMGQTAFDLEQPLSRRHEAAGGASATPERPADFVAGARPALPDTRPPGHIRRRSHRGRGLVLAVVLALACMAGAAGIAYALSHRHHGALPPAAARSVPPALTKQGRVVREYFAAINDHRYLLAYRLGGHSGSLVGLKAFELGFAGTKHDIVTIDSVNGDVVTATLVAEQTDGTVKKFQGTYTVINGKISSTNVGKVS
ncbi:MAG TPA: protein kinase [Streptosporangiaceae bacterium]